MEDKLSQQSTMEMELFKIPIDDYEDNMDTEEWRGKKKEILDLFTNYNRLRSKKEYEEIEFLLYKACKNGDLDSIKIYLNESITNISENLVYKIDKTNQTASLFKSNKNIDEIYIPRTVKLGSVDYLITSIGSFVNNIKTIKFAKDSSVKTIYRNALYTDIGGIERIYFPSSLKELKEGWCCNLYALKKIIISPSNSQFIFKDGKYLLGKTDPNNNEFDTLLFARRDIKEISIPLNIKIISSDSFHDCKNLTKVEIPPNLQIIGPYAFDCCFDLDKVIIPSNSKLQTIEIGAFSFTKIEEIYFPSSLKELKEGWCCGTNNLKKIIISPSNGQYEFKEDKYLVCKSDENDDKFDTLLFVRRDIEEFSIPSNIKIISSYAFHYCRNMRKVKISPDSNLQIIGVRAFSESNIKEIFIPPKVSKICEYAFQRCQYMTKVEFPVNSNLQIIGPHAFSESNIEEIIIPPKVLKICENAFLRCDKLAKIEIPLNSNLQTIKKYAFSWSNIDEIYFPSSLKELKESWCYGTINLKKITISPSNNKFIMKDKKYLLGKTDPDNNKFDNLLFTVRDIEKISIPSNIKIISSDSYHHCKNLTKIEILPNSNLQIIGPCAFSESNIEEIFIPPKVTKICENAFERCQKLAKVEISPNSNLQIIESNAFSNSKIEAIFIPPKVSKICKEAFLKCFSLSKVEIPANSNLQTIGSYAFSESNIKSIFIPSNVTKICESAFSNCENLQIFEISEESELKSLSLSVFYNCPQLLIMIPSSLRKLI